MVYGRFQRAGKSSRAYGRKRTSRVRRTGSGYSKMPRFATASSYGNIEKKYFDKTYQSNTSETLTGQTTPTVINNGVTYVSNTWGNYTFGAQQATATSVSNDMLKGVATGTTARTRIGNKLKPRYVKGAFTFNAAIIGDGTGNVFPQGGEILGRNPGADPKYQYYLRTSFRFVIVKDMQVNSTDTQVTWPQVFDTQNLQAGIHSELNVDNMGRFVVLEDKIFTLDSDTPQKTVPFMISGTDVGQVRYNGPSDTALTSKGLYVVWAAFVMGFTTLDAGAIALPSPVGHSRMCFTDD